MKRFWLILLSLGLIAAFSTSAMAVDVKLSGEFYTAGMYLDSVDLVKSANGVTVGNVTAPKIGDHGSQSTAFYFQRLRVKGELIISPGLLLRTRADIMERAWGAARSVPGTTHLNDYLENDSAGTDAENQNIAFDELYLEYLTPVGLWQLGLAEDYCWGTAFGDSPITTGTIFWAAQLGQFFFGAKYSKEFDNSSTAIYASSHGGVSQYRADNDLDGYSVFGFYKWKNAEAGLLIRYNRDATGKKGTQEPLGIASYTSRVYTFLPYVKAKIGPVAVEAEVNYAFGDAVNPDLADFPLYGGVRFTTYTIDSWRAYINAMADFGKFYGGGTFAFLGGHDPNNTRMQGALNSGTNWNPCLILWNYDRYNWAGGMTGNVGYWNHNGLDRAQMPDWNTKANADGPMTNAYFVQGKVGVRPVDKLDINATLAFASAVVKPSNEWLYNDYGWELDLTATYKITNNLSYMLGGGYLFTGKYFKGADDSSELRNNYLVINKLTLTF